MLFSTIHIWNTLLFPHIQRHLVISGSPLILAMLFLGPLWYRFLFLHFYALFFFAFVATWQQIKVAQIVWCLIGGLLWLLLTLLDLLFFLPWIGRKVCHVDLLLVALLFSKVHKSAGAIHRTLILLFNRWYVIGSFEIEVGFFVGRLLTVPILDVVIPAASRHCFVSKVRASQDWILTVVKIEGFNGGSLSAHLLPFELVLNRKEQVLCDYCNGLSHLFKVGFALRGVHIRGWLGKVEEEHNAVVVVEKDWVRIFRV